jgi:hypothetical protein
VPSLYLPPPLLPHTPNTHTHTHTHTHTPKHTRTNMHTVISLSALSSCPSSPPSHHAYHLQSHSSCHSTAAADWHEQQQQQQQQQQPCITTYIVLPTPAEQFASHPLRVLLSGFRGGKPQQGVHQQQDKENGHFFGGPSAGEGADAAVAAAAATAQAQHEAAQRAEREEQDGYEPCFVRCWAARHQRAHLGGKGLFCQDVLVALLSLSAFYSITASTPPYKRARASSHIHMHPVLPGCPCGNTHSLSTFHSSTASIPPCTRARFLAQLHAHIYTCVHTHTHTCSPGRQRPLAHPSPHGFPPALVEHSIGGRPAAAAAAAMEDKPWPALASGSTLAAVFRHGCQQAGGHGRVCVCACLRFGWGWVAASFKPAPAVVCQGASPWVGGCSKAMDIGRQARAKIQVSC